MARVKGFDKLTGTLGNVTFYTIQGSDQIYARAKGGPRKRAIKTKPQFEKLRRNNSEWAGCAKMGSGLRMSYGYMKHLEDFPAIGALNGLAKKIQHLDTTGEHGKRSICVSKHKDMIAGFNLSRKQVFESVLRVPLTVSIDRAGKSATVKVPPIDTAVQLYNFRKLPYFRLLFSFMGVPDLLFPNDWSNYQYVFLIGNYETGAFTTDWLLTSGQVPPMEINLYIEPESDVTDDISLVLSVGLEFGQTGADGVPQGVKYAGCGKIMMLG